MHRLKRGLIGLGCLVVASASLAAQDAERDFDAELTALEQEYEEAQKEWMKAYREAKPEERAKLVSEQPGPSFLPRFQELANDAVGTEAAGSAWMWVIRTSQGEARESCRLAIEILVNDYTDSEVIAELPDVLRYSGPNFGEELCESGLRTLATESLEPTIQAPAMYNLAAFLTEQPEATDAHREEATGILNDLKAQHPEVEDARGRTYLALANGLLNSMNIAVGKPAPEIEGNDLDGVAFKLSDYRGKVVLLDFWGHW